MRKLGISTYRATKAALASIMLLLAAACTSVDCPLNNSVYSKYELAGNVSTLADTMIISTTRMNGGDTMLINRDINISTFSLPMSYEQPEDVLYFEFRRPNKEVVHDTLRVAKENQPHFESVDCSPSYFHTITSVSTTNHRIDSVVIKNKNVNYDASQSHFYIYLKPLAD